MCDAQLPQNCICTFDYSSPALTQSSCHEHKNGRGYHSDEACQCCHLVATSVHHLLLYQERVLPFSSCVSYLHTVQLTQLCTHFNIQQLWIQRMIFQKRSALQIHKCHDDATENTSFHYKYTFFTLCGWDCTFVSVFPFGNFALLPFKGLKTTFNCFSGGAE